jgi:Ca-activated chloride channel family protein
MTFAWPENFGYLLLLIPLAVILGYGVIRHLQAREAVVSARMAEAMMPGVGFKSIVVKKVMIFLGIASLLIALTGPRLSSGGRPVLRKGADMVFVLDVSRSMKAADVLPDRLAQSKYEITRISRAVTGGRRAIVLFAAKPLVQCPLTADQDAFEALLGMASPDLIEAQGTVFRSALELAETILEPSMEHRMASGTKGEKIIVLLSDGEDHAGDLPSAARRLKKRGIHVFLIGAGMLRPVVIPLGTAGGGNKLDKDGKVVTTSFNPETLRSLARESGGFYFHSTADHAVYEDVSSRINRIAAASRWVMEPVESEPLYYYFLGLGLLLLLAETMITRGGSTARKKS